MGSWEKGKKGEVGGSLSRVLLAGPRSSSEPFVTFLVTLFSWAEKLCAPTAADPSSPPPCSPRSGLATWQNRVQPQMGA